MLIQNESGTLHILLSYGYIIGGRKMVDELKKKEQNEVTVTQYDISVIPNDYTIITINNLIDTNAIEMPVFQRNYIWDRKRASRFIESLILGLPVPQIFLYQKERNKFLVIDGQQRLLTIYYFIKQRFPLSEKRVALRKIFDENGSIPEEILASDDYFQDFKLQFTKTESNEKNPLDGLKYFTLGIYKSNFEFMTMRCMAIRQNEPKEDDSSVFEIFSRLNTGGVNLNNQEIRACLYHSEFYQEVYRLNQNETWRKLWGKPEDGRSKDVEVILRSFALLCNHDTYNGSMNTFISKFSKNSMKFSQEHIRYLVCLFLSYLQVCKDIPREIFSTNKGEFNSALFDCIFVAIGDEKYKKRLLIDEPIDPAKIQLLKDDDDFIEAITHSTSHTKSVTTRIEKARQFLK